MWIAKFSDVWWRIARPVIGRTLIYNVRRFQANLRKSEINPIIYMSKCFADSSTQYKLIKHKQRSFDIVRRKSNIRPIVRTQCDLILIHWSTLYGFIENKRTEKNTFRLIEWALVNCIFARLEDLKRWELQAKELLRVKPKDYWEFHFNYIKTILKPFLKR